MAEERAQTEFKRGNTTIHISTDFCAKTPEEVEAILARISERIRPEMVGVEQAEKE